MITDLGSRRRRLDAHQMEKYSTGTNFVFLLQLADANAQRSDFILLRILALRYMNLVGTSTHVVGRFSTVSEQKSTVH